MNRTGEILTGRDPFSEIVIGNTAVVRAMLEAGVDIVTAYPGSPTPEIADAVEAVRAAGDPLYFEYSTNEKVAAEVAFGASISGMTAAVFFKSVGLNVAADSVVQFGLLDTKGGLVIILGDDPGANSSQNEQDNRHFARMAGIPVFEPADPRQVYEMFIEAVGLSKKHAMPVFLRMTTHVCHAKALVDFGPLKPRRRSRVSGFHPEYREFIPLTSAVYPMKARAFEKMDAVRKASEASDFNLLYDNGSSRGVITCGLPSLSASELFSELDSPPDMLVAGMPWPLPIELIMDFCSRHEEVLILEELDDFIEKEVKSAAFDRGLKCRITGKSEAQDFIGELRPANMRRFIRSKWPSLGLGEGPSAGVQPSRADEPPRPAQMCPGCGHRSAFHAIAAALKADDITVADIGCHTLGYMKPYRIGEVLLSMGHSNGTGAGLALANGGRRVVTFLGDSTFFHAGLPGLINAVSYDHDLTLIIMENGTTAMTGHQDHPGTSFRGAARKKISIKAVLEALGVEDVAEVDTYRQAELTAAVKKALEHRGFSAVIARHPCMLKLTRENRRRGVVPKKKAVIDQQRCDRLNVCVADFACPSFVRGSSGEISVNPELCIGDGSCLQVCPSSAIELTGRGGDDEK